MAENNRNRGYRTSNQDWNENRSRSDRNRSNWDDDRNYSNSENRGYGNSDYNRNRDYDDSGNAGWQSRYQREEFNRGTGSTNYTTGRYGRQMENEFDSGNYNERDYGYSSNYGGGSSYGGGTGGYGGSRGLYDRDYEGMGRRGNSNSGSRIGGSNYGGGYSDRDRNFDYEGRNENRSRDYNEGRNYGSGYTGYAGNTGGNYGRMDYGRKYGSDFKRDEDRGFWDRASDEVAAWFGDEDAEHRRDRDRMMRNSHKGKGPKNYSRSDDRIKEDINDRLSDDPFIDASEIEVTVSNAEVTLTGTVEDRSNKRRAEDLAEAVSGVKNVENRIRVSQNTGASATGTKTSMQNRESQSSDNKNSEKEKQTTGSNAKKDYVTG